jgi:predicted DNA-binding protein
MATSLKLSPKLKSRVVAVSREIGKSPHAFMVEAIERQTENAERRQRFVETALTSEQDTLKTRSGFDAE